MNVFVLSTGRCGSTTFARACQQIENYSAAHESKSFAHGKSVSLPYQDLEYPEHHIEIDNRLAWFLGRLNATYAEQAFYVHLIRAREAVAKSFANRWDSPGTNIIRAYAWGPLTIPPPQAKRLPRDQRLAVGRHYWDTVNENISNFLADKPRKMTVWLEDIERGFESFWQAIGATGDLTAAMAELRHPHNASEPVGPDPRSRAEPARTRAEVETELRPTRPDVGSSFSLEDGQGLASRPEVDETIEACRAALSESLKDYPQVDLASYGIQAANSSWSLDTPTLQFLVAMTRRLRPQHILELGSGISTGLLLRVAAEANPASVISSVDHDPDFARQTSATVAPDERLSLQLAPLVSRRYGDAYLPAYCLDTSKFASSQPIDLCLIDGPPTGLGGRAGTLYQVLPHCRPGSCVLLDDAAREREREALSRWTRTLGDAIEIVQLEGFPKGLAAVIVHQPIATDRIWQQTLRSAAADLNKRIPACARALLIDQWQWPDSFADEVGFEVIRDESFPPATDDEAIQAVRKWVAEGVDFVVFAWPSFWWFDSFPKLQSVLSPEGRPLVSNDRVVAYDVRGLRNDVGQSRAVVSSDERG